MTRNKSAGTETDAFGLYVHWPFCLAKCPYCDFNSHVRKETIDEDRIARAIGREIETIAARLPGRTVNTIFFGGGTPSLMRPDAVAAILEAAGRNWKLAPDAEIAWWRTHNAKYLLALRLHRANHQWLNYWNNPFRQAA